MTEETYKPYVSVVIPTYHDWKRLQLCLSALDRQTYPKQRFEIIVVNNDTSDIQPINLKLPDNCIVTAEGKPGSYAARNKGVLLARGEIVAFTDSDCRPESDWIETAVVFFTENKSYNRIGGSIKLIFEKKKLTLSEIYEKSFAFRQSEFVEKKGMAATGNMFSRNFVFNEIGLFDETMMSGGDAEWGMRAKVAGHEICYLEQCIVWHPTRSKFKEITKKTKREAGGHLKILNKKGKIYAIVNILAGIIPPFRSFFYILRRHDLSLKEKIISFFVRYYLRLISSKEKVLILLGFKLYERV